MKMFRGIVLMAIIGLLLAACSEKQPGTMGQAGQGDADGRSPTVAQNQSTASSAAPQATGPKADQMVEINGTLMRTDEGLVIVGDTGAYVLTGQDLTDMIGETVKVTGTLVEMEGNQAIDVMAVNPLE